MEQYLQISLCISLAIMSLVTLFDILERRCEWFSILTLMIILSTNSATSIRFFFTLKNGRFWLTNTMLAFVANNFIFSLQFLRSSLTVPLYFERREKLDSNMDDVVSILTKKIVCKSRLVTAGQIFAVMILATLFLHIWFKTDYDYLIEVSTACTLQLATLLTMLYAAWSIRYW